MAITDVATTGGDAGLDGQRSQTAFEQTLTKATQAEETANSSANEKLLMERIQTAKSVREANAARAEKRADALEDRLEAAREDPKVDELRLDILELRSTIADDRAEFFNSSLDSLNELEDHYKDDEPVDEVAQLEIESEGLREREAYLLKRAEDLTTLASLVAEKGHDGWSEKLLIRADNASEQASATAAGIKNYDDAIAEIEGEQLPEVGSPVSNEEFVLIQEALSATDFFGESQVDSARNITSGELDAMRQVAIDLGADEADLEFFDFIAETVPIQIVFVDGMAEDLDVYGATRGEAAIPTGIGILMDSTFVDTNFDDGLSGINNVSAQGAEVFLYHSTQVLQDFEIIEFSGETGDGDPFPELAAGETVNELDGDDQATFVELSAGDYIEDTAVLG